MRWFASECPIKMQACLNAFDSSCLKEGHVPCDNASESAAVGFGSSIDSGSSIDGPADSGNA